MTHRTTVEILVTFPNGTVVKGSTYTGDAVVTPKARQKIINKIVYRWRKFPAFKEMVWDFSGAQPDDSYLGQAVAREASRIDGSDTPSQP